MTSTDPNYDDLSETALLVVDAQPTFMPGGELPVPGGDAIIEPLLALISARGREFELIAFSRDWHPLNHFSFDPEPRFTDGSWPVHGVAGSESAQVHPALIAACEELGLLYITISKGMEADTEAYSAFDFAASDLESGRCLDDVLIEHGINRVLLCGLAGEVCVQATALAGRELNYEMVLLLEATAFLGDPEPALASVRAAGVITNAHLKVI